MEDELFFKILANEFIAAWDMDVPSVAESLHDQGVEDVDAFYERAKALAGL